MVAMARKKGPTRSERPTPPRGRRPAVHESNRAFVKAMADALLHILEYERRSLA